MIAKNLLEEDEDGCITSADIQTIRSMCSNPLFVGDGGYAQNMGIVTLCEGFKARKEYRLHLVTKKPRKANKTRKARIKKP